MITIVCGTNRPNSNSMLISTKYATHLTEKGQASQILNLQDLPHDFIYCDMYGNRSDQMNDVITSFFENIEKFVFVIPEYNGGFPGVLKAFVDCLPSQMFHNKKAGLVGVSSGFTGCQRGMDQFTSILNYLKVNVLYSKPKLSQIEAILAKDPELKDKRMNELLDDHANLMIGF
ncbi:MAG: chromate reductase [Litorivivens sp.]|jgi:chromate reductase